MKKLIVFLSGFIFATVCSASILVNGKVNGISFSKTSSQLREIFDNLDKYHSKIPVSVTIETEKTIGLIEPYTGRRYKETQRETIYANKDKSWNKNSQLADRTWTHVFFGDDNVVRLMDYGLNLYNTDARDISCLSFQFDDKTLVRKFTKAAGMTRFLIINRGNKNPVAVEVGTGEFDDIWTKFIEKAKATGSFNAKSFEVMAGCRKEERVVMIKKNGALAAVMRPHLIGHEELLFKELDPYSIIISFNNNNKSVRDLVKAVKEVAV